MTVFGRLAALLLVAGTSHATDAASGWVARRLADCCNVGDPTAPAAVAPTAAGWLVGIPGRVAGVAALVDDDGRLAGTLVPPTPSRDFGRAVRASGAMLLVAAPDLDAVYVFDATTRGLVDTLRDPDAATGTGPHEFGRALAVGAEAIVVGAPFDDRDDIDAGAAYVFDRRTRALRHRLASPSPFAGARFGTAVAVAGDEVIVGAPAEGASAGRGAVHVFSVRTGAPRRSLTAPPAAAARLFGYAVAARGRRLVVGAPCRDGGSRAGAAVVYDRTSGEMLRVLAAPSPERCDFFGGAVSVAGGTIAVGARLAGEPDVGAVHVFSAATGESRATFAGGGDQRGLGWSVAIRGAEIVAGAAGDGGKVRVFSPADD